MTEESEQSAARANLFDLISTGFSYPTEDLYRALTDGRFADAAATNVALLGNKKRLLPALRRLTSGVQTIADSCSQRALESQYISLFELNRKEKPLHLYGHLYARGRPDPSPVYQRLQRIYRSFGIELKSDATTERPDHLTVELEFMAYLQHLLYRALIGEGEHAVDRVRKGIDTFFAELDWIEEFVATLEQGSDHAFYVPLGQFLRALREESEPACPHIS